MKLHLLRIAALVALVAHPMPALAKDEKPSTKTEEAALPDPVAIVEGEKISRADLQEAFNRAVASSGGMNPADLTATQKMEGYREILDQLIIDKLISRKASSLEITDADLDAEIAKAKGQFPDAAAFKAEMEKAGETES
ncbi:MAG: SurA N-terminal domain-containing protein, partial [Chthoniobacterales bacterium]